MSKTIYKLLFSIANGLQSMPLTHEVGLELEQRISRHRRAQAIKKINRRAFKKVIEFWYIDDNNRIIFKKI